MIHKKIRKGAALLCTVLLVGATACKTEPAKETRPVGENSPEVSGEQTTGSRDIVEEGADVSAGGTVTQAPELYEAIAAVRESLADESAERTAVVKLSDTGIEISGSGCEADGSRLKIKEAGVYEISGTLSNGSIYVNVDNESEVHLIFNGVTIHNETSAAVFCKKVSKVTLTLADGSVNTLSDGANYVFEEEEDEPDATLYAKHDLVINGNGKLVVTSAYGDAVKGKDALYILEGTFEVTSAEDGIVGRDLLYVADGTFTVNAASDALKANNDTDETLGNVVIDGGSFTLTAEDDGIHAENILVVTDGNIHVAKSYEGLEALNMVISGGEIEITASDDGLNAAGGNDNSGFGGFGRQGMGMFGEGEGEVTINGGNITVNAEGDGLDSNGNLTINGGTVVVFGPTSGGNGVLDYGGTFALNGGSLFAAGSSQMAQTPSASSGQYSLAAVLTSPAQAGGMVEIVADGKTVFAQEVPKQFNYMVVSSKEFTVGAEVSVVVDGKECYAGALTDTVTCFGFSGGMGDFGGFGGEMPQMPEGERPGFPKGEMPQMPGGERPGFPNGESPELPEGEWPGFSWGTEES